MTAAQLTLVSLGILIQFATFALGVMVGLVKRKESHDRNSYSARQK